LGRGQRPAPTKIAYGDSTIGPVLKDEGEGDGAGNSFEAFGIVGKLEERILRFVDRSPRNGKCARTTRVVSLKNNLLTF
jgi:hypothetical protein